MCTSNLCADVRSHTHYSAFHTYTLYRKAVHLFVLKHPLSTVEAPTLPEWKIVQARNIEVKHIMLYTDYKFL